jgi:hypothetical protein
MTAALTLVAPNIAPALDGFVEQRCRARGHSSRVERQGHRHRHGECRAVRRESKHLTIRRESAGQRRRAGGDPFDVDPDFGN